MSGSINPDMGGSIRAVTDTPRAVRVLKSIPRTADNSWVIPGRVEGRPMRNIDETWGVVCELAGLRDTRIHDCRHSFASRALALGEQLPMIGRLLGHSELQATERYAHLDRDWIRDAAVRISESIAGDILTGYTGLSKLALAEVRTPASIDENGELTTPYLVRLRALTPRAA